MARYVVNVNDPTAPTDTQGATQGAEEIRALKLKMASVIAGAIVAIAAGANTADVQTYIQPDVNDRPSMVAGGWIPWSLNQQWGGAGCMPFHMVDSATGTEFKFDAIDGYVDTITNSNIGSGAGQYYIYQVLTSPKICSLQALWLKLYKTGNPIDNVTVQLYTIAAGVPGVLIATANLINGKQITSDANGQWYRFVFAAVQVLASNTQYAIVVSKSAGVDAGNNYNWRVKTSTKYPNNLAGVGTVVPAWTPANTQTYNFLVEVQATDQTIQSGGQFNGKIVGAETNPINRSTAFNKPLKEFFPLFNPNGWSISLRGKSWTKDRTIFEAIYGIHHDRINVRSLVGTGVTTVTLYKQDGTVVTLSGISDLSTATFKDIMITGRNMGDGGDYLRIYVGTGGIWTKEAEIIAQTFIFDPLMLRQGTGWLMGGFQLFKNTDYTKLSDMIVLPSADGWTFTGTAAEGNVFAVSNGKLNQIKSGYGGADTGFYRRAALALSNANGWLVAFKNRITNGVNTKDTASTEVDISDGTKQIRIFNQEYYSESFIGATIGLPQLDLKTVDVTQWICGKGSDALRFANGKLIEDLTSFSTGATANNQIDFGDNEAGAAANADVVWDYMGYYNTAVVYPQFTSGELHEFAVFSGDKNLLGQAVYNLGIPLSFKQYCGISKNYTGETITQKLTLKGITFAPTVGIVYPGLTSEPEMEGFILGSEISVDDMDTVANNTAGDQVIKFFSLDGNLGDTTGTIVSFRQYYSATGGYQSAMSGRYPFRTSFGLHKIIDSWSANSGGTATTQATVRTLNIEAKP